MNRTLLFAVLVAFGGVAACGDDSPSTGGGGSGGAGAHGGAGAGGIGGGGGAGGGVPDRYAPLVAALEADLAASQAYGVSVAVMEGGELTFAHAIGSKDSLGVAPLTPHTLMQIGSTTKQMTAAALLQKVEAGQVTLDESLETALPMLEFALDPTWDDQATLHHLISHQGGVYDYTEWDDKSDDAFLASLTYGEFASNIFFMAPPGSFWNYSNPNFILAGLVTEENDTRAWPDIMRQDVFTPLGMDRTFLRKSEVEADGDYSLSFGLDGSDLPAAGPPHDVAMAYLGDSAWTRPAGLTWTTPSQQMLWAKFLMEGNDAVLSSALRQEITSEQVDTLYNEGTLHYGYGMFVHRGFYDSEGTWYPATVWEHGGNTLSFSNELYMVPDQDFAIAITSSGLATDFSHSVEVALTTLVDLPTPSTGPSYQVDPAEFVHHVGTYNDAFNVGQVIITQVGDKLNISMPALDAMGYDVTPELQAVSSNIFMLTVSGQTLDLTFIPDSPGGDSTFIRNRAFVAARAASGPQPTPPKPSRATIDQLLARARMDRLSPIAFPPALRNRH